MGTADESGKKKREGGAMGRREFTTVTKQLGAKEDQKKGGGWK